VVSVALVKNMIFTQFVCNPRIILESVDKLGVGYASILVFIQNLENISDFFE
jgi:hypothetical protein